MKKKNITLRKLNLNKSNVASFNQMQQIVGGSVGPGCNITDIVNCPNTQPSPATDSCACPQPTGPSGCLCPSQEPICFPTQENCVTQQTCGGNFLCDNQTFGGGF